MKCEAELEVDVHKIKCKSKVVNKKWEVEDNLGKYELGDGRLRSWHYESVSQYR